MMRSVRVVAKGLVQGVGYRAFVAREAGRLGLKGWVRNRRDGTVEAVLSGSDVAVETMCAALRRGPAGASVTAVCESAWKGAVPESFAVWPTA